MLLIMRHPMIPMFAGLLLVGCASQTPNLQALRQKVDAMPFPMSSSAFLEAMGVNDDADMVGIAWVADTSGRSLEEYRLGPQLWMQMDAVGGIIRSSQDVRFSLEQGDRFLNDGTKGFPSAER